MAQLTRFHVGPRLSEMAIHQQVAYLAGQVPENMNGDIVSQTREVMACIDRLLAEAGTDKTRLLQVQIFLRDIADFQAMNEVWDAWVATGHTPPRATVEARLANPECLIEIVCTAALA